MQDSTNWTPYPDDNLLGITDKHLINEYEAKGLTKAELYIFELDTDIILSNSLVLAIHKIAFGELYDWAGKWREVEVTVGQLVPPPAHQIINLMYQFLDNVNYKISISNNRDTHIECLVYSHYEFIKIHPFNNGNGRTGRILMNLIAMKLGYKPLELYYRDGESRKIYIDAMKSGDQGDFSALNRLINEELTSF